MVPQDPSMNIHCHVSQTEDAKLIFTGQNGDILLSRKTCNRILCSETI